MQKEKSLKSVSFESKVIFIRYMKKICHLNVIYKKIKNHFIGDTIMETQIHETTNMSDIDLNAITQDDLKLTYSKNEEIVYDNFKKEELFMMLFDRFSEEYKKSDIIDALENRKKLKLVKAKKEKPQKSYGKFNFKDLAEKDKFLSRVAIRSYIMKVYCYLGFETGLRSSDLLNIDFKDIDDFIKSYKANLKNKQNAFTIHDVKTGKLNAIYFTDEQLYVLEEYVDRVKNNEVVELNSIDLDKSKLFIDLDYDSVYRFFKKLQNDYEEYKYIKGFCTHLLRRTCCYIDLIIKKLPLSVVMHKLNHANQKQTLDYACLTAEEYYKLTGNRI